MMLKQNLMQPKRFDSMDPQGGARMDLKLYTVVYSHFNIQPKAFAVVVCSLQLSSFICLLKFQPPKAPTLWVQSGQNTKSKDSTSAISSYSTVQPTPVPCSAKCSQHSWICFQDWQ